MYIHDNISPNSHRVTGGLSQPSTVETGVHPQTVLCWTCDEEVPLSFHQLAVLICPSLTDAISRPTMLAAATVLSDI
jgi:hypothetical protein